MRGGGAPAFDVENGGLRPPLPTLSLGEVHRYSRHLVLPEVGMDGQRRFKAARILLVGAGGLGSPAALYLTAAGIGHLTIVDPDVVDVTNLQRQVLHGTKDLGRPAPSASMPATPSISWGIMTWWWTARTTSSPGTS